jgi:hypothetical protein
MGETISAASAVATSARSGRFIGDFIEEPSVADPPSGGSWV